MKKLNEIREMILSEDSNQKDIISSIARRSGFVLGNINFKTGDALPGSDKPKRNQYGSKYSFTPIGVDYYSGKDRNDPNARSSVKKIEGMFKKLVNSMKSEFGEDNIKVLWFNGWATDARVRGSGDSPAPSIDIVIRDGSNMGSPRGSFVDKF